MNIETIIWKILSSGTYALISYIVLSITVAYINHISREKVRENDLANYKKIIGKSSMYFERGGVSPADIGTYIRFYKYLISANTRNIIGTHLWLFYRVWVVLYVVSLIWVILSLLIFIAGA